MSLSQQHFSAEDSRKLAQQDFNFLGMLCMPEVFAFAFPAWYILLFSKLTKFTKRFEHFALGLPRGFAKTTWMKLLCVWYILFSDKKFILIVCAAEDLAVNVVSDVMTMLGHENIVRLFGSWEANVEENQKHKKVFYFRGRTIIIQGIGAGTSVRGVNRNNQRPDVMIMDDIQKKEDAKNPELAKALMQWMLGTLMMAKSDKNCTFIFIGNMYPQNSILQKLKESRGWESFIVGGILEDGTSLWEELKPIETLLDEWDMLRELGEEDIFISEVLNSTELPLASGLDLDKIQIAPKFWDELQPDGSFIIIDPSGADKTSDDCTIEYYEVKDTLPILRTVKFGTFTPKETIIETLKLAMATNTRAIGVEAVAYQKSLLFWFNDYCEQHGISGFHFVPLSPRNQAKNTRIKKGITKLCKGEILLHTNVVSLVKDQYKSWNPLKRNNKDDIIDPIGYVEEMVTTYSSIIGHDIILSQSAGVSAAHSDELELPF